MKKAGATGDITMRTGPRSPEEQDKYFNEPEHDAEGNCLHPERLRVSYTAGDPFTECRGCKAWTSHRINGWRSAK